MRFIRVDREPEAGKVFIDRPCTSIAVWTNKVGTGLSACAELASGFGIFLLHAGHKRRPGSCQVGVAHTKSEVIIRGTNAASHSHPSLFHCGKRIHLLRFRLGQKRGQARTSSNSRESPFYAGSRWRLSRCHRRNAYTPAQNKTPTVPFGVACHSGFPDHLGIGNPFLLVPLLRQVPHNIFFWEVSL